MDSNKASIAAPADAARVEGAHADVQADVYEGVGAMLRKRRVALGLSQGDVANVVKLPARRIEAMEQERWEELPDGPYLRGFLKNIARALNLDAATLIDRVDQSLMRARNPDSILVAPGSTHAMLPLRSGPAEGRYSGRGLVIAALVFAVIAALIAGSGTDSFDHAIAAGKSWVAARSAHGAGSTATTTGADVRKPVEAQTRSEAIQSPPTSVATTLASSTGDAAPRVEEALRGGATSAPGNSAAAGGNADGNVSMQFHFSQDSWVEVRGGDGKVLLSRLNAAGTEQSVEGEPPFSLIVGNAKGVSVSFRGRSVDLTPFTRDQVARFTLS